MSDDAINPRNALLMVELDFTNNSVKIQWDENNDWLDKIPMEAATDVIGEDPNLILEYLIRRHVSFALERAVIATNEIMEFMDEEDAEEEAERYEEAMENVNDLSDEQLRERVMKMIGETEGENDDLLAKLAKMTPKGGIN